VKHVVFAILITLVLGVGGVALTFAFRSPDAAAKLFSPQELAQQETEYRSRTGGTTQTVLWEPNQEVAERGRFLYTVSCMTCHGVDGDGEPVTPEGLPIRPRDFSGRSHKSQQVMFKFTSLNKTEPLALDEDLRKTIKEGLPGTPMPGFSNLSADDIDALLEYIKTFGYASWKFERPQKPAIQVPQTPLDLASQSRVESGSGLFKSRGCIACHGDVEQGGTPPVALPTEWLDDEGKPIFVMPRNFATEPLRRPHPEDIFKTIQLGIGGTVMPANPLPDDDTWDLIAFVLHLQQQGEVPAQ